MTKAKIRDFIYLDIDRVRSFAAQLLGGLTSERVTVGEHQVGGDGEVKGTIPLLAEATGSVDYRYVRSLTETKSLHDALFAEFLDKLTSEQMLRKLADVDERAWKKEAFKDGAFFSAQCPLKVLDYASNMTFLRAMPQMQQHIMLLTSGAQAETNGQIADASQVDAMGSVMEQLYGDMIRVKIFPFAYRPDKVLIGSAQRDLFRYRPMNLTNLYGPLIDANWTCIVQVNKGARHPAGKLLSKSGNTLEDHLEQFLDEFTGFGSLTQGIVFPAVAITPIAIYREIR